MSRLESMRRRLSAQIDGINWAADRIKGTTGDVLELGLGNGRTYDHLRQEIPHRRIWVIDRVIKANPSSIPPAQDFLQGEADDMMRRFDAPGTYLIDFMSNDGLEMKIGGQEVVYFDGVHGCVPSGQVAAAVPEAGWYALEGLYFQRKGSACLMMRAGTDHPSGWKTNPSGITEDGVQAPCAPLTGP